MNNTSEEKVDPPDPTLYRHTGRKLSLGLTPVSKPDRIHDGVPSVSPDGKNPAPSIKLRVSVVEMLPADPVARNYMDAYKDHSRTAYHHEDDVWEDCDDITGKLRRLASRRSGRLPKEHLADTIDPRDGKSPDSWIKRSPDLIRLTGRHPMNAEPSPTDQFDQGFITPVSIHYVRNHGKVPKIDWSDHRITIGGLVKRPTTWTMDELIKLPATTLPVTICCSGQRRKEMNMIAKTVGFNFTTTAQSCNLWTGVKLSYLLEQCGADMEEGRFVWLEGTVHENLPNGTYGTSIDLVTAINPYEHVLIAYEQNGIRLHPDHGYPVRCVVPGYVGARGVKWIEKITVMDRPSDNFYHYHDNKILPSFVDAQIASQEGWFYRDEYVYNQLNISSVCVYPAHQDTLHVHEHGSFTIKGFAYSGGGRKITRVELSFDEATSWKLCSVDYPEERYSNAPKFGKYFAWMFWEYTIDKALLVKLAERGCCIRVRAWDCANNTQPFFPTWSLLGQGNNSQYVVKMMVKEEFGIKHVEFIHPVAEANNTTGWMKKAEEEPLEEESGEKMAKSMIVGASLQEFTMAEIAKHNTAESAWLVIEDSVYDVTKYLKHHPGGAESIIMNGGDDATEDFLAIHSKKAKALLDKFYIGEVAPEDEEEKTTESIPDSEDNLIALHPKKWREFELIEKVELSHDTRLFKFKLQSPNHSLGLPTGHHMFLQASVDGKSIVRAYTPVSPKNELGTVTLCIKVYMSNQHPKFPEGGKMTQYLENMTIGDTIKAKGPIGHFEYKGQGKAIINGVVRNVSSFGMICGGTGLTPAYQVLQAIYDDPEDKTEIHLLYANRSEEDILMRAELERMEAERDNIKIWYTITVPSASGWKYSTGYINAEMLQKSMPDVGKDVVIGLCGPPLMITDCCIPNLEQLGYNKDGLVVF